MTREEALNALRGLALGLEPNTLGVARLLERIASQADDAEALRDALTELGARALLDGCRP